MKDEEIKYYNHLNFIFGDDENFNFMNHGYYPTDQSLTNEDIFFKNSATLYLYILKKINLKNIKSLLEIGCGRGGGLSLIHKRYKNLSLYGCDICKKNIDFCNKKYKSIQFDVQDACDLNFSTKFDVVLNIESSHGYDNYLNFFQSTSNCLKNEGYFLYCDMFWNLCDVNLIKIKLKKYFSILEIEDITENVYKSCRKNIELLKNKIKNQKYSSLSDDLLLDIFKVKENTYKTREQRFIIFICKKALNI